ncbi:MAG: hypothetical protein Fur0022_12540 [Anaerolineales bacterium]
MEKRFPQLLFPFFLVLLMGIIYVQTGGARTLRAANRALADGDPARAGALFASVAAQSPEYWEAAGVSTFQGGDHPTAFVYLQHAETTRHLSGAGYVLLGDLFLEQGKMEDALTRWEIALEKEAPALDIYRRMLTVHRVTNDFPAAIADLRAIVSLAPGDAQAHLDLGLLLVTREPEEALLYLNRAAELDTSFRDLAQALEQSLRPSEETDDPAYWWVNVGRTLASLGEWGFAKEAFIQAVTANPNYAEAWAFLGEAKGQLGEDGLAELDMALNLNPGSLTANTFYALYQKRQGNFELALVYLHAADTLEPDNPSLQVEIGSTLSEMGDFNRALAHFQKAVALAPYNATYLHLLAQFCFQHNTQVEEVGLVAVRQALVLNPDDPVALDLMGFGYYLLEDLPTAQRFLLEALELTPEDPRPWFHLALVSLAYGDSQQAYDQLTKAVSLDPESSIAGQARRVLARYFP